MFRDDVVDEVVLHVRNVAGCSHGSFASENNHKQRQGMLVKAMWVVYFDGLQFMVKRG
jgi:hypothetical protein